MKILVVGAGGREHALVMKIRESPLVSEVFAAPGNGGMAAHATLVPIDAGEVVKLAKFAAEVGIDLAVVGPEAPLFLGIEETFRERNIPIVAPSQAAAELEGSKIFAKGFMARCGIPTADYQVAESAEQARKLVRKWSNRYPLVIKADGNASGKGVVIARDKHEAEAAIQTIMVDRRFGAAGDRVLIEECLTGEEASVFVLSDGHQIVPLVPAQDHKRLLDGDEGPNTGGMGAYSPVVTMSHELYEDVLKHIVAKTVAGLAAEGREFRGALFVGLMLTATGPKVLEYNTRLGDPEAQTVLARLKSDLVPVLKQVAEGRLQGEKLEWRKEAAVTVVLASRGYPQDPMKGQNISGLDRVAEMKGVSVAHAGTRQTDEGLVVSGGRVLGVTALAPSLKGAVDLAYQACDAISYDGKILRRDIGHSGLQHLKETDS